MIAIASTGKTETSGVAERHLNYLKEFFVQYLRF